MYTVIPTERFEKDVRYYVRKKGFVHIEADIKAITDEDDKRIPSDQEIIRLVETYCM